MNKKILILFMLVFMLFSVTLVSARYCDTQDILHVLRKALYIYYTNPAESTFTIDELRSLLTFYIGIQSGEITVDCTAEGEDIDRATALPDNIPSCSDGTKYGRCSSNNPFYCYAGNLVPRCRLCGCPEAQYCDVTYVYTEKGNKGQWGKCNLGTDVTCAVDSDCGVSGYVENYYCKGGNVYRNYTQYTCLNPGETISSCAAEKKAVVIDDCGIGEECVEGQSSCQAVAPPETCSDGTLYGQCSTTKPKYCDNGVLIDSCGICGCDAGLNCNIDGTCQSGYPTVTNLGDIDGDGVDDTLTNTGIDSGWTNISDNNDIIALTTSESLVNEDLNGDGDKNDNILRYYDVSTGIITNTNIDRREWGLAGISGNTIALLTYSGDLLKYYDINTGTLTNTNINNGYGGDMAISGNIIALLTKEGSFGEDLNGDGDNNDYILRYYDLNTGTLTNTKISNGAVFGSLMDISGNIIALRTPEDRAFPYSSLNEDLNGDGDKNDYIIRHYDISTGILTNTKIDIGYNGDMAISGNTMAFTIPEGGGSSIIWPFGIGGDMNGDGDQNDVILLYYDISTETLVNTGVNNGYQYDLDMDFSGNIVALLTYERPSTSYPYGIDTDLNGDGDKDDTIVRYYDISTGTLTNTKISNGFSGAIGISGNIIMLLTPEHSTPYGYSPPYGIDADLNGDGDKTDYILRYITLSKYA